MQHQTRRRPVFLRAGATSQQLAAKPGGGRYDSGLITGVVVVTRGPIPDRGIFVDREFMQSVTDAINSRGNGVKCHLGHPSIFRDGLGDVVGMFSDARVTSNAVRADLHVLKSAHRTPRGNLAEYVLGLAAEAPDFFGASIYFIADDRAEDEFLRKHSAGGFQSPDTANPDSLPHARLKRLIAIDLVDEPASNPAGLFESPTTATTSKASSTPASKVIGTAPTRASKGTRARRRTKRVARGAPLTFTMAAQAYAKRSGISLAEAMSYIARTQPEMYALHISTARELAELRYQHQVLRSTREGKRRQGAARKESR